MSNTVHPPVYMNYYPMVYKWGSELYEVLVEIDTEDVAITVLPGVAGKKIGVVGVNMVSPTNETITFMSGNTEKPRMPLGNKSGLVEGFSDPIIFATEPGDAFKIKASVAEGSPNGQFLFYLVVLP